MQWPGLTRIKRDLKREKNIIYCSHQAVQWVVSIFFLYISSSSLALTRFNSEQRDCYNEEEIALKFLPRDHGYRSAWSSWSSWTSWTSRPSSSYHEIMVTGWHNHHGHHGHQVLTTRSWLQVSVIIMDIMVVMVIKFLPQDHGYRSASLS